MEVQPGGGSTHPEPQPEVEGFLFVLEGSISVNARVKLTNYRPAGLRSYLRAQRGKCVTLVPLRHDSTGSEAL